MLIKDEFKNIGSKTQLKNTLKLKDLFKIVQGEIELIAKIK